MSDERAPLAEGMGISSFGEQNMSDERERLVVPVEIVRVGPNALVRMFRRVMVSPRSTDFTVFHDDLAKCA